MSTFVLRKIDPALWEAFKAKALQSGQTPKAVLLKLIADYAHKAEETKPEAR